MNEYVNPLHSEIAALRDEVDHWKYQAQQMRSAVTPKNSNLQERFDLTASEAAIMTLLSKGGRYEHRQVVNAILRDGTDLKTIDVYVCKIRKKIAPIKISREWGRAVYLAAIDLKAIRAIIAGEA